MIYLDNAATSFPKPRGVYAAVTKTMKKYGGSPSRASHPLARAATEAVYSCREAAGALLGCESENVIITYNATHALNLAIKGLCADGSHILISDIEHNSVLRPVVTLCKSRRCSYDVYPSCAGDADAVEEAIVSLIRYDTRMIVANHTSNICGIRLPVERIGRLCRERGITFIVDLSQAAGHVPVNIRTLNADAVCMAGHKGLFGPQGTGLLILDTEKRINTLLEGGTGILSNDTEMPNDLPERLEAGTLSAPLAAGLATGMRFLSSVGIDNVARHESELATVLAGYLDSLKLVRIYDREHLGQNGCVLFNVDGMTPSELSRALEKDGICTRSGLHCSPLAHKTVKSGEDGAVRVSFGYFNTLSDVWQLAESLNGIVSHR